MSLLDPTSTQAPDLRRALPIGVFDSGIGGLTVARALADALPHESLVYFGDTAHLPYGDKSPEVLQGFIRRIAEFLLAQPVKAIVIACNTASAVGYDLVRQLAESHGVPVFQVVTPAVEAALAASRQGRVGVIGTKTTVQSHVYLRQLLERQPDALVIEKATPLLVPMIEEGWAENKITDEIIEAYLSDTGFVHIDVLIMGCTHYPLIQPQVERYFATHARHPVQVINSSVVTAETVRLALEQAKLLRAEGTEAAEHRFYVSDLTLSFEATAALFFGTNLRLERHEL